MNPIYMNDGELAVGVTEQQLQLLRATRDHWFKFLKVCNSKHLEGEQRENAAKFVMIKAIEALELASAEEIKLLPPAWMAEAFPPKCKHLNYVSQRHSRICDDCEEEF
jgi:hypothetical protein